MLFFILLPSFPEYQSHPPQLSLHFPAVFESRLCGPDVESDVISGSFGGKDARPWLKGSGRRWKHKTMKMQKWRKKKLSTREQLNNGESEAFAWSSVVIIVIVNSSLIEWGMRWCDFQAREIVLLFPPLFLLPSSIVSLHFSLHSVIHSIWMYIYIFLMCPWKQSMKGWTFLSHHFFSPLSRDDDDDSTGNLIWFRPKLEREVREKGEKEWGWQRGKFYLIEPLNREEWTTRMRERERGRAGKCIWFYCKTQFHRKVH